MLAYILDVWQGTEYVSEEQLSKSFFILGQP